MNSIAYPTAKINFKSLPTQEIIPVVYITTNVFQNSDSTQIQTLAANTLSQVIALHPEKKISALQIDCDWMASIKDKYFYFLKCLKLAQKDLHLSCTIRLYQYKYYDLAGVPPVDEGVLMYYNMGELTRYEEPNSILNNEKGNAYLGFGKYPIPLDFALPRFSWSLIYRFGEFQQIMGDLTANDLKNEALFRQQENDYYMVLKDTVIHDTYLRFGDEVRFETCKEADLVRAATLLKQEKNQSNTTLLFYDLDPTITYDKIKINSAFTTFQ